MQVRLKVTQLSEFKSICKELGKKPGTKLKELVLAFIQAHRKN